MSDFKGVAYPIVNNAHGFFRTQEANSQIKSDLLILLLTNPGERVMLPDFGTPLRSLLFEPNDETVTIQAEELIAKAIEQWEPRIGIDQIEVTLEPELTNEADDQTQKSNALMIRIKFKEFENIKEVQELELFLPINGTT